MGDQCYQNPGQPPPAIQTSLDLVNSYESACRNDPQFQSFDNALQASTSRLIGTVAVDPDDLELRSFSFDTIKEVTGSLLEMNQEVEKIILQCKKDIWKDPELFDLVEEFFENSLQMFDFCTALEKCLKHARDSQLIIQLALQCFELEWSTSSGDGGNYSKTLEQLKNFMDAGDPFSKDFFRIFGDAYKRLNSMLNKLQLRKTKLVKKLPATLAAAVGSVGKWVNSLFKDFEAAIEGEKELISSMWMGTFIAIKDMDNIRPLVENLEGEIQLLVLKADFAQRDEKLVRFAIEDIKKNPVVFTNGLEDLGNHIDTCNRDIRSARTLVLQKIIKLPG